METSTSGNGAVAFTGASPGSAFDSVKNPTSIEISEIVIVEITTTTGMTAISPYVL